MTADEYIRFLCCKVNKWTKEIIKKFVWCFIARNRFCDFYFKMLSWLIVVITANFLADVVLSSKELETVECTQTLNNATGRDHVSLCKPVTRARGYDEQPSYSMLIQAAYGLSAITILVVAYFIFRAVRFVLCLTSALVFVIGQCLQYENRYWKGYGWCTEFVL